MRGDEGRSRVAFKLVLEPVQLVATRELRTNHGVWNEALYWDGRQQISVLSMGDPVTTSCLCRIHSFCYSAQALGSVECSCASQMQSAQELIAAEGVGVIVILDQDGRGFGHRSSILASHQVLSGASLDEAYVRIEGAADGRSFRRASDVLQLMRVKEVRLLTDNPRKVQALTSAGISVTQVSMKADHRVDRG